MTNRERFSKDGRSSGSVLGATSSRNCMKSASGSAKVENWGDVNKGIMEMTDNDGVWKTRSGGRSGDSGSDSKATDRIGLENGLFSEVISADRMRCAAVSGKDRTVDGVFTLSRSYS